MMAFAPNVGEIIIGAFARIQVRRTEITASHMADARHEANLLQVQWGNKGPNLWTVDQQEFTLRPNVPTYPLFVDTIEVLDSYISTNDASDANADADLSGNAYVAATFDRLLNPIGRSEYLQTPNKDAVGTPNAYWFRKGEVPQITFWPVPDQAYTFYFWRLRQITTADPSNGNSADVPYLWYDAFTAGLAHRLARIYALPLEQARKADAAEAWTTAATQDEEMVPVYISPDVGGYYR